MRPERPAALDAARRPGADRRWSGPDRAYLHERRRRENFPVALRVLPAGVRRPLRHLYDVARVIDDLGDEAPGDRTTALLAFRRDLEGIWQGQPPRAPVLRGLAESARARGLSRQPFLDLIEANLLDQRTKVYATFEDLLGYCALSANPVGRTVLEIFGASTPDRVALSDRICTALQIIEHCQDVAEDHRAGRLYLPVADLDRFGVRRADLGAPVATAGVRRLVGFEAERAEAMLIAATPLLAQLRGWARLAVAGYVAGGHAALAAMRREGWSVLPSHPPARRRDVLRALVAHGARPRRGRA